VNAKKLLSRTLRDAWRVEALEPRVLLSADPVLGGLHALLMPVGEAEPSGGDAYQAEAPALNVATVATPATAPAPAPELAPSTSTAIDAAALIAAGQFHIGEQGSSQPILLTAPEGGALFAAGDLVLYSDGVGGHIHQDGDLVVAGSVNVYGSGHTYLLSGNISAGGTYTNSDSIRVDGARVVASTGGNVVLGGNNTHYLGGNSSSTVDTLSVSATGNIVFNSALAAGNEGGDLLSGLSITAAQNVTFEQAVEINGDLIINATGIVTFKSTIVLKNGGDLIIQGATQIVMQGPISLQTGGAATAGDILLEADEIDFLNIGEELISGTGSVTLRPSTLPTTMAIFSPSGAGTAGVLNLESSELKSFADGFSSFTFGHQSGGHAVAGSGAVLVGASASIDSVALQASTQIYGGSITVVDYSDRNAILRLGTGDTLKLDAIGDISIANEIEADTLVLASSSGRILQTDAASDNRIGEALRALDLSATAVTGISLPHLELQRLTAVNSGAGDIDLGIDPARSTTRFDSSILTGAVTVQQLAQTAGSSGNDISLLARAGNITLAAGSGIAIAGDGALSLRAQGAGSDLSLLAPISVHGGAVTLSAADALSSNASGSISSTGASAVALTAGTGVLTLGAAVTTVGGVLTLNSGAALNLTGVTLDAGASGSIALSSVGDMSIGIIQAANAITLTSSTGALIDALAGDGANLRGEAALATLSAATGIGSGAAPLRTALGSLTATVSGGGIFVAEETVLTIAGGGLSTAGSGAGAIVVRTTNGALDVQGAVHAAAASGHVLLQAVAGDLSVAANVIAEQGSISLLAAQALMLTGAIEVRARAASQTLDLRSGGMLTMGADVLLATQNAGQRLDAGIGLVLGRIDAGSGAVSLRAGMTIAGAAGAPVRDDIVAGSLRLQAQTGAIGGSAEPIGIAAAQVAASAQLGIHLREADTLAIGAVTGVQAKRVAADGSATALAADATLSGLSAGAELILQNASGDLSLLSGAAVSAGSHLRLAAAGALNLDGAVSSTGGAISLIAGGALTHGAAGDVSTLGGAIDEQAGTSLSMAVGTTLSSQGGRVRLQAGSSLTLGQVDAGSGDVAVIAARIAAASGGTGVDIAGAEVRLRASGTGSADGIGSVAEILQVQAQTLALQATGTAGVFINESDALTVASLASSTASRVQLDGSLANLTADAALAGLSSAGALVLSAGGALTINSSAAVQAATALRLQSGADLSVGSSVTAGSALSLHAGQDLLVLANLAASGGKGVDLLATRDLLMSAGTRASAAGASALSAGRNLRVAEVDVGSAGLALSAGGWLWDVDADGDSSVNLRAGALLLSAAQGVGTGLNHIETSVSSLAASGGTGGVFITESDALSVAAVSVSADRVGANGVVGSVSAASAQGLGATGSSAIVLRLLTGNLSVDTAVQAVGGAIRLEASGGTASLAAAVSSAGGPISLLASGAVQQTAAGDVSSGGGSIDLQSGAAWLMADGAEVLSSGGALRLAAGGLLTVGRLDAGSGAMSLLATGLRDIANDTGSTPDIAAGQLRLSTSGTSSSDGIGSSSDALEIAVQRLALASLGGGVFLNQSGALMVDSLSAMTLSRVGRDGWLESTAISDAALAGASSAGSLVLRAAGSTQIKAAVNATGTILLQATGASSALSVDADVHSSTAALSLLAEVDLLVTAKVSSDGSTRSLDLQAGRDILLQEGSSLVSKNGAIALQAGEDVLIESIDAGTANVAVIAGTGNIVDGDAAGDSEVDIKAGGLRLTAGELIGLGSNALETTVTTLSASGALLALTETQGLRIDRVAVALQRVGADGVAQALDLGAQEDLSARLGIYLSVNSGDLQIEGGTASPATAVSASQGQVLLRALTGALTLNAGLTAGGAVSLRSGTDLNFGAAGDLSLASTLDAEAGGSLNMTDGAVITATSGALRLAAGQNLSLGALSTAGDVSLSARHISDAGGAEVDVLANGLRVLTTGTGTTQGFGTSAAPITIQVTTLAADVVGIGAGGLFVQETDGLVIGTVGPVLVSRVGSDGSLSTLSDAALSDLVSGGNVVIVNAAGSVSVTDGANADGRGLQAGANVLIDTAQDLNVSAAVRSAAGSISLLAGGALNQSADVTLARTGRTIDVQVGGVVTMGAASSLSTVDAEIRVQAGGDIAVGNINSGRGKVSLISTGGSIVEAGSDAAADITAAGLRLSAAVGVGTSAERLDTAVATITARAAGGGIWLQEADVITIGDVAVSVRRVGSLATTATEISDAAQSDLITTAGNGSIALSTLAGNILFADGTAPLNNSSISAHGSGTVSLSAGGANAVLDTPAGDVVQQGPVLIDSGLKVNGAFTVTAGQGGARGDGAITINGAVNGSAGGAADTVALQSDGADVRFIGAVGNLEALAGLSVNDARNVRFDQDVTLAGHLQIQASGRVEFLGTLNLSSGSLNIVGATELVIGNVVISSGDAVIHVDALTLAGLITGSSTARLEVAGAGSSSGLGVGSSPAGTGLALNATQLAALRGFGTVALGRNDQGATAVDVATLSALNATTVELAGSQLSLQGSDTVALSAPQLLKLSAAQDLTLSGRLNLASAGADLQASAGGALLMAAASQLNTLAGDVQLQAVGDLALGRVDTRSGATAAQVVLASTGGVIRDAGADTATDVFADKLTFRGHGPLLAAGESTTAAAIDVSAAQVDIDARSGVVLRDTGLDGRTRFNLLDGLQLRQQVVAEGPSVRQPSAAGLPGGASAATATEAWAWLSALRPLEASRDSGLAAALSATPVLSSRIAALTPGGFDGIDGWTDETYRPEWLKVSGLSGLLPVELEQAWLLGSASAQPTIAGSQTQGAGRYEMWTEALSL